MTVTYGRLLVVVRPHQIMNGPRSGTGTVRPCPHICPSEDGAFTGTVPGSLVSHMSNGLSIRANQSASSRLYSATKPTFELSGIPTESHWSPADESKPVPQMVLMSPSMAFSGPYGEEKVEL